MLQDLAEGPLEGLAEGRYAKRPCKAPFEETCNTPFEEPCNTPFEGPCATSNAQVPISDLDFFLLSVKAY